MSEPHNPSPTAIIEPADDLTAQAAPETRRKMVLNMGPQHPSTHGVLRVVLELDHAQTRRHAACASGPLAILGDVIERYEADELAPFAQKSERQIV